MKPVVVSKRTWVQGRPAAYSVAGEGMPVLLLHGWALADHTYRGVIEAVAAQGCRVIAPAMPGFGGTGGLPGSSFSISGYGRWVNDFLGVLEIREPAVVMGHSFGGGVAVRFAYEHRAKVRSLVLVNAVGGSSWRKGNTLRSIAERPLWDWGLHFPADVWPLRQATKVVPVMAEDFVPNMLRNPRAMLRVASLARRADLRCARTCGGTGNWCDSCTGRNKRSPTTGCSGRATSGLPIACSPPFGSTSGTRA
jgi:pimeloyl-ACP methyl ester carboxylesterase